jgi:hypothetical protein
MVLKPRWLGAIAAAIVPVTAPARAEITVFFDPAFQTVNIADGTASVDIVALVPEEDAIVSWGLDMDVFGSSVSISVAEVNALMFDPVTGLDGDPFAGLVPPEDGSVWGDPIPIVLATVTLSLDSEGMSTLSLSDNNPADLTEGFALNPPPAGAFAGVVYETGAINVVPEPTVAALLGLASAALLRRRR